MLNKNSRPYFDSFDEDKQFYQILFRPKYPIQTRELNELQSMLQNQISRFGNHVFKEGSMVIPGQISVDQNHAYVKIESEFTGLTVSSYIQSFIDSDVMLIGQTSGVTAKISGYAAATESDPLTIFVRYIGSGYSGSSTEFTPGEIVLTDELTPRGIVVSSEANSVGFGSAVNLQRGVYFVRNKFVLVTEQTLIIDKYSNNTDVSVGLSVNESFITPEEDSSLLDNAQGGSNYAAPGAHRHYIDLRLTLDDGTADFIELIRIKGGVIQRIVDTSTYSVLAETLERRTYDESGNYTVTPFNIQVKEHRSNDRGAWMPNTYYLYGDVTSVGGVTYVAESNGTSGIVAPTHTTGVVSNGGTTFLYEPNPTYNNGAFDVASGGDATKIAVGIDAGKAYVLGREIINSATKFIAIDKAQTFDSRRSGTVPVSIGSYLIVDNMYGPLDVTAYPTVALYDRYITANGTASGTQVGTAIARYVEYDSGTIGTSSCMYLLSLVDIKMNSGKKFESDVRSFFFDNPTGANFTANAKKTLKRLTGAITTAAASTAVSGIGTTFTTELAVGDSIVVYNGSTQVVFSVASIASDTSLTLTANAGVTLTSVALYRSTSSLLGSSSAGLIMPIPQNQVRKVRDIDNESASNTSYYTRQKFSSVVAGTVCTINSLASTETFASPQQPDSFMVMDSTTGDYIAASITLNPQSTTATIDVGAGHNGNTMVVIATVRKVMKERSKTMVRSYVEDFTTQATAISNLITLSKTDGVKLRKVSMFTDTGGTPVPFGSAIPGSGIVEIDITKSFTFSGGQTDAYYGASVISRTIGSSMPVSPIRVVYDYFEHGSTGDYFSVDSYSGFIPTYKMASGAEISLGDVLDFRCDRPASGFVPKLVPAIGFDIVADYTYYLPRVDKLYLSANGGFDISSGVPSLSPVEPTSISNVMNLATISVKAKTNTVDSNTVVVNKVDNRRYTMRDIGAIDRRLANVEYYTALSLLEQQTYNLQLFDNQGNLNFKNGFVVEPFTGQNIGDVESDDYRCSIDPVNTLMRPAYSIDNVNLIENTSSEVVRGAAHYTNHDNIITLPYEEVVEIAQPFASRTESVTPFIRFNFTGRTTLTPASDEWYETAYAPSIVIQREGNYSALEKAYKKQLGTVWNAWKTNWTTTSIGGVSVSVTRGEEGGEWGPVTTSRRITQTTNQTRTGTSTVIQAVYDDQVIDDRIIRVDLIPYIRSRSVLFVARGMKPSTTVYPFFDSVNVGAYVTPASSLTFSSKTGEFDTTSPAGNATNHISRRMVDGNASVALSFGDVIHNGAANDVNLATATAVVVLDEDLTVRITNVKGTFVVGQTVYGSLSGVSGVISMIDSAVGLTTNEYGEVAGVFDIPSSSQARFLTGQRTFRLSSSPTNSADAQSIADGTYTAAGYTQVHQQTIVSTRNGVVQQTKVTETRNVSITIDVPSDNGQGGDPLAQSFKVTSSAGMFVTGVDVFFAGKDRSIPLWFNIVEMSNGTPTTKVIPGSHQIIRPSKITVSDDASVATRITMPYPIYLRGDTEYAFVMGSDSTQYFVWISRLGELDIATGKMIVTQPYLGSMFKSQNASTWDPSQMEDVKFNIIRAKFDTMYSGNVGFIGSTLNNTKLSTDPFFIKIGSNKVRVSFPNNGLVANSLVTISGAVGFDGIPAIDLNKQHTVVSAEQDSFIIQIATTATSNGFGGGSSVVANGNVRFDLAQIMATQLVFDGTSIKHFINPTTIEYGKQYDAIEISANENTPMVVPMLVASKENEVAFMSGTASIETTAQLTSNNDYISPVLDITKYSMNAIGNRINNPTGPTINVPTLDPIVIGSSTAIAFSATNRITTVSAQALLLQAKVGRYLTIAGAATPGNNGSFPILEIAGDGSYIALDGITFTVGAAGPAITLTLCDHYVSEIAPESGSADAKYIIKTMNLNLPARQVNVYLDVSKPASVEYQLYYRVAPSGKDIKTVSWTLASPTTAIESSDNQNSFAGVAYNIYPAIDFDSAQIKIVQLSSDTTKVAITKNVRMIASS